MAKSTSGNQSSGERKWGKRGRPPAWWVAGYDSPLAAAAAEARAPSAPKVKAKALPKATEAKPRKRAAAKKAAATQRKGATKRSFSDISDTSASAPAPVLPFPTPAALNRAAPAPNLSEQVLTPEGFDAILQTCLKHSVTRLKLGHVEIWMRPAKGAPTTPVEIPSSSDAGEARAEVTPQAAEDAELSQALIDDPVEFEQRLIDGHLKGAAGGEASQD